MATIYGGAGDNSIVPAPDVTDLLYGNDGNDTIYGGGSSDTIYGGNQNDTIYGGTGADRMYGDNGDDYFYENDFASGGTDALYGGAGTDTVDFSGGSDGISVVLSAGNATVNPPGNNPNTDSLFGFENVIGTGFADTLTGDDSNNLLSGMAGIDLISGGIGLDTLYGGVGVDTIYGGADSDLIAGGDDGDTLVGDAGADTLYGDAGADRASGNDGLDLLYGGVGNDTLYGGNDGDLAYGGDNADLIYSDAGVDTIYGDIGADTVYGGTENDYISGGNDGDRLFGDSGNDTIEGGLGSDSLSGGAGVDLLTYANSATAVNANLLTGTATGEGTDTLLGFENLTGSSQGDVLTGDQGANVIDGGAGTANDTISGNLGNDTIIGGAGDDVITGGPAALSGATTPLDFNWSSFGDENPITTGTTQDTGGINVNVTYTPSVANEFTVETSSPIYVGAGEPFSANSAAFLQRPGAGAPTSVQFDFSAIAGSNLESEVTNLRFRVSDVDRDTWQDRLTVTAFDADGNPVPVTITELSAELTVTGNTVLATGDNTNQFELEGSVLFTIAGPVAQLIISYDNAQATNQFIYVSDLHFDAVAIDDDSLIGGDGNDSILGGVGNDTLVGDAGRDTLYGGLDNDRIYGGAGNDIADGGDGNDTIYFGADDDTVYGGAGNDLIDDTASGTENGLNLIYGGAGNDTISSGNDADTLYGDAGNDSLSGEAGNDTLYGGADNDTLNGGAGQDLLYGGAGTDTIYGDGDQDLIYATFTPGLNDILGAEIVDGGSAGTDNDTLRVDITGFGWARFDLVYDPLNNENGTMTFFDGGGLPIGTITFTEIENIEIVCFTTGTRIMTDRGPVPVEDLAAGDLVLTRDNGLQPLTWVGKRHVSYAEMLANPSFQPVRIGCAALAGAGPDRVMLVSPQHRLLLEGARAEMYFGELEVLVPAKHLLGTAEVTSAMPAEGVTYVHILFDQHEIVLSDGIWTESFQPAARTLSALEAASREEVLALFPELAIQEEAFPAARLTLKSYEARVLVSY